MIRTLSLAYARSNRDFFSLFFYIRRVPQINAYGRRRLDKSTTSRRRAYPIIRFRIPPLDIRMRFMCAVLLQSLWLLATSVHSFWVPLSSCLVCIYLIEPQFGLSVGRTAASMFRLNPFSPTSVAAVGQSTKPKKRKNPPKNRNAFVEFAATAEAALIISRPRLRAW